MSKNEQLDNVYFFLLERTVRRFRKFSQRELSKRGFDISGEQWVVLKKAHEEPGISQRDIAKSTFKDPASVTRMIDLLEHRGLVKREDHGEDRRSYSIHLTKEGLKFVEEMLPLAEEMRKFGLRDVTEFEKQTFIKVLNKIYENLE